MLTLIRKIWRYFKCVICMRSEVGLTQKKKFGFFGKGSYLAKPFLQLSGEEKISIGNNTTILQNCRLAVYGDENRESIIIGNNCYIGFGFSVLASAKGKIHVGDNVLIASNVLITNENHGMDPEAEIPYMDQDLSANDVTVGDGCWIGEKVTILPGSIIGKKSIIGAHSVVNGSIPDYSIAAGIPAKVIKRYNFNSHKWERING